jgi:hypothetical protein
MAPFESAKGDDEPSPRPLKRARKGSISAAKAPRKSEEHHFVNNSPVDRIFITDAAPKKLKGKKVHF